MLVDAFLPRNTQSVLDHSSGSNLTGKSRTVVEDHGSGLKAHVLEMLRQECFDLVRSTEFVTSPLIPPRRSVADIEARKLWNFPIYIGIYPLRFVGKRFGGSHKSPRECSRWDSFPI